MTRVALITTTINVPTNLEAWRHCLTDDDVIVIAGDLKSPHDDIEALVRTLSDEHGVWATYLTPQLQSEWAVSYPVGWNCIQRRNLALLEALKYAPRVIVTIDDDNYPTSTAQVDRYVAALTQVTDDATLIASESGWFNVGEAYDPPLTHRGYPLDQRHVPQRVSRRPATDVQVGVFASLWSGDPDVDAVERIVENPLVTTPIPHQVMLDRGTWCPFNSQATAFRAELAPLMLMWPGVGRYDDIWASYVTRRVLDEVGWYVRYGHPIVTQQRNPHDLVRDLEDELLGYRRTPELCAYLRELELPTLADFDGTSTNGALTYAQLIFDALGKLEWLPERTLETFDAWEDDLTLLVAEHDVTFHLPATATPIETKEKR